MVTHTSVEGTTRIIEQSFFGKNINNESVLDNNKHNFQNNKDKDSKSGRISKFSEHTRPMNRKSSDSLLQNNLNMANSNSNLMKFD